jgi:hypothetical protein
VAHLVIICGVCKSDGQQALLLEVGFMDARKRLDEDSKATQVPGLQRSMLAAGPLTIVVVSHHNPANAFSLVVTRHRWDGVVLASQLHTT